MTVLALHDGGSAIWSPVPLREAEMSRIEALGPVRFLIVPNRGHRLDLKPWKDRYPGARIIAPPTAREAVMEAAPVDATTDIIGDPNIDFQSVAGTKEGEFAPTIQRGDDKTLILNDILSNVRHPKGLGARLRRQAAADVTPGSGYVCKRSYRARKTIPRLGSNTATAPDHRLAWRLDQAPREALVQAAADFEH